MNIYEHFSKQTALPISENEVKSFIIGKGVVSEIDLYACDTKNPLRGVFQKFYGLAAPYCEHPIIVRVGYPRAAALGMQRLVKVKEMLHALDPFEATSPTKKAVTSLIDDLLVDAAEKEIGLPAQVDSSKLINALCVLMPIAALDLIRPRYKADEVSVAQVAEEAKLPASFVEVTLSDEWRAVAQNLR